MINDPEGGARPKKTWAGRGQRAKIYLQPESVEEDKGHSCNESWAQFDDDGHDEKVFSQISLKVWQT